MFIRRLLQSRLFLFLLTLILSVITLIHYLSSNERLRSIISSSKEDYGQIKILLINDREPSYKLVTYEGYQFPLERNRAQTELLSSLKLKEKCSNETNTTILDVGASLGEFAFYAAACGCQVFIFEIQPKKLFFIQKTIEINSFQSNVHLIKRAVTHLKSNNTIYFSKTTNGQILDSTLFDRKHPDIYMGTTINLNSLNFSSIYILRVDVQGHELNVFRSTEKYFLNNLVNHVIFEYTPWGAEEALQKDIFNYLKQILRAKNFYALHPKQSIIYGPLSDEDLQLFYSDHQNQHLQRDIYASFNDQQQIILNAISYSFSTSF